MPELRSGARQARLRSKRLDELQPPAELGQPANPVPPPQNRTGRRAGTGRGRAAAKGGPSNARQTAAGRGRGGGRVIGLDLEQPCEVPREQAIGGADEARAARQEAPLNKNLVMEGGSADKLAGPEEEASATPVPERVGLHCCWIDELNCLISTAFVFVMFLLCVFLNLFDYNECLSFLATLHRTSFGPHLLCTCCKVT